ncbi:hypothetical protein D3C73_1078330 [compost metagenome]
MWSLSVTISVPNCSTAPFSGSRLMICTRWPAVTSFQSPGLALGKYLTSSAWRSASLRRAWPIRYCTRSRLSLPTSSIGPTLLWLTDEYRSHHEPCLRNLVLYSANGPNRTTGLPSSLRASRCGTDIGGEPVSAMP